MKTVLLRGPLLTHSGYGQHFRQIAKWFFENEQALDLDISCELLGWGVTGWMVDSSDPFVAKCLEYSQKKREVYDVSVQLQLPNEWNPFAAEFNVGVTAGVETDICNPEWVNCANKMDLVIVPSEFTKKGFTNSGEVTTTIEVVPEAFNEKTIDAKPFDALRLETPFNFLVFGQLTGNNAENDRKNLFYTMKWITEVFAGMKDVGVVLKTNGARNTKIDMKNCKTIFANVLRELNYKGTPRFTMVHGALTDEEVAGLYVHPQIKGLVSLTRGEGFGIPTLDAAAAGLPVIATDWSAHTEYLNLGKWIKVKNTVDKIHPSRVDNQIFMPEAKWAHPSETDAKTKLLKFYQGSSIPAQWAKELAPKIRENYSLKSIFKHYDRVFSNILK